MSQVLVILIDPEAKTITADTIEDNLASMQQMVGGNVERAYPFEDKDEALWLDDEGKLKENFHYNIKGYPDILTGKSFICREVDVGDDMVNGDTQLDVAFVQDAVSWLPHLDNQQLL